MSYCPVAGIDVSKRFSDMCILSPDNKIFAQEKIYHDETCEKFEFGIFHCPYSLLGVSDGRAISDEY